MLFFGEGAGARPTSSAVIADIVSSAEKIVLGAGDTTMWKWESGKSIKPMSEIETRYYMRMNVADQPGVLAQLAEVLGNHLISISSVIQKEADSLAQTAELVIMTHSAREAAMQQALEELRHLAVVQEIKNFVRVEA